jgi:hypothetical protein
MGAKDIRLGADSSAGGGLDIGGRISLADAGRGAGADDRWPKSS